jgi:spermidine/putrescine transport system ATP-binding protein
VQFGTPSELYDAPANRYVADFVGESNFVAGQLVESQGGHATVRTADGRVLAAALSAKGEPLGAGGRAVVAVRPEAVRLWPLAGAAPADLDCRFEGRVENRIFLGDQIEFAVASAMLGRILARVPKSPGGGDADLTPGAHVGFGWRRDRALALADA